MCQELFEKIVINKFYMELKMYRNQKIGVFCFFKWLSEQYIQLERKTLPYSLKLGYFPDSRNFVLKNGKIFMKVEFSGQKDAIEIELSEIIEQNLFEYFSPADKKKDFFYSLQ